MSHITDDHMRQMLATAKEYTVVLLKAGPNLAAAGAREIIWEHARRNFELRAKGLLAIVCPVNDGSELAGVGVFDAPPAEVVKLMDKDPGVRNGTFTYEVHPCRSFPGDGLPG